MRMFGPVMEAGPVRMRPPLEADLPTMVRWFEDLEVTRTLGSVFAPGEAGEREWLERVGPAKDQVAWVIEFEGRLVGTTAIVDINWVNRRGRTGILIGDRSVWGRGVASEVMRLRTAFAFDQLNLNKLTSGYMDGNDGSRKAQLKVGYREVGRSRQHFFRDGTWIDEIITEVLRDDWLRSR